MSSQPPLPHKHIVGDTVYLLHDPDVLRLEKWANSVGIQVVVPEGTQLHWSKTFSARNESDFRGCACLLVPSSSSSTSTTPPSYIVDGERKNNASHTEGEGQGAEAMPPSSKRRKVTESGDGDRDRDGDGDGEGEGVVREDEPQVCVKVPRPMIIHPRLQPNHPTTKRLLSIIAEKDPNFLADPNTATSASADQQQQQQQQDLQTSIQFDPSLVLALWFLIEEDLDPNSQWRPYLDMLPRQFDTPLYWIEDELALVEGSNLHQGALQLQKKLDRAYEVVHGSFGASHITRQQLVWAFSIYASRAFGVYCPPTSLISAASASSSSPPSTLAPNEEAVEVVDTHISNNAEGINLSSATVEPALLPYADIFNHQFGPRVNYVNHMTLNQFHLKITLPMSAVTSPVPVEIFNNYGPKPNEALLLSYGFVLADNPHNSYWVHLGLMDQDPYRHQKLSILSHCQLPLRHILTPQSPLPQSLLFALRVCLMDERELEYFTLPDLRSRMLASSASTSMLTFRNEHVMWKTLESLLRARLTRLSTSVPSSGCRPYIADMALQYREEQEKILHAALESLGHQRRATFAQIAQMAPSTKSLPAAPLSMAHQVANHPSAQQWLQQTTLLQAQTQPDTEEGQSVVARLPWESLPSSSWIASPPTHPLTATMSSVVSLLSNVRTTLMQERYQQQQQQRDADDDEDDEQQQEPEDQVPAETWLTLVIMADHIDAESPRRLFYQSLTEDSTAMKMTYRPVLSDIAHPDILDALESTPLLDSISEYYHRAQHAWKVASQRVLPLLSVEEGVVAKYFPQGINWDSFRKIHSLVCMLSVEGLGDSFSSADHLYLVPTFQQYFYNPHAIFRVSSDESSPSCIMSTTNTTGALVGSNYEFRGPEELISDMGFHVEGFDWSDDAISRGLASIYWPHSVSLPLSLALQSEDNDEDMMECDNDNDDDDGDGEVMDVVASRFSLLELLGCSGRHRLGWKTYPLSLSIALQVSCMRVLELSAALTLFTPDAASPTSTIYDVFEQLAHGEQFEKSRSQAATQLSELISALKAQFEASKSRVDAFALTTTATTTAQDHDEAGTREGVVDPVAARLVASYLAHLVKLLDNLPLIMPK